MGKKRQQLEARVEALEKRQAQLEAAVMNLLEDRDRNRGGASGAIVVPMPQSGRPVG